MATFVTHSGPLFDGRAAAAARDFCNDFEDRFGDKVKTEILQRFGQVFKHPTGRYESTIHAARAGDGVEVTDGGGPAVYGPWLEGTGSRNRTTRFKGYFTFRMIGQRADREAGPYAERMIDPYVRRMQ